MIRFRQSKLTICIAAALPILSYAKDTSQLEKLGSDSLGIEVNTHEQTDNSRIYLEQGAIWVSRDIMRFDPVLDLSISSNVEVRNGKPLQEMSFAITTNFSYYVDHYQLEVYRGGDRGLVSPLAVVEGQQFANDFNIVWDGKTDQDYQFESNTQLLFRLKAFDKDGNMDVTSVGVIDLVDPDSEVDIDKNDGEEDQSRKLGKAQLMRHNIPTSAGLARFMVRD